MRLQRDGDLTHVKFALEGETTILVMLVRPLPVLYACQGCPAFGQRSRDVGRRLERANAVELVWLGAPPVSARTQRYPIYALDGCREACAVRWLECRGIVPERSFVLRPR